MKSYPKSISAARLGITITVMSIQVLCLFFPVKWSLKLVIPNACCVDDVADVMPVKGEACRFKAKLL